MGQIVPKLKAHLSHDLINSMGQCVAMADDVEDIAESQWRDAFRARVREAQGDRKDKDMAKLLGITPERYRKYVGGGAGRKTVIPVRLLTRFCLITDRPLQWLIDGPEEQIKQQKPRKTQPSMKRRAAPPRR
jgi:CO/xanthine dehydrogenase Mo-binding subunit